MIIRFLYAARCYSSSFFRPAYFGIRCYWLFYFCVFFVRLYLGGGVAGLGRPSAPPYGGMMGGEGALIDSDDKRKIINIARR